MRLGRWATLCGTGYPCPSNNLTFSRICIETSPSGKRPILAGVSGTPNLAEISPASSVFALPVMSCRVLCEPPAEGAATTPPGRRDLNMSARIAILPEQNASFSRRASNSGHNSFGVPRRFCQPRGDTYLSSTYYIRSPCMQAATVCSPRNLGPLSSNCFAMSARVFHQRQAQGVPLQHRHSLSGTKVGQHVTPRFKCGLSCVHIGTV
eukprot:scaffold86606_cov32-Tisochrysis_lutea.AAC.4